MTRETLEQLDTQLNELNSQGKILEGLDRFYADECLFQEGNEEPIVGKATQKQRLSEMFSTLQSFNGATLRSRGVGDDVTHAEWTFDMTGPEGESIVWNEVLVRSWDNGQIVRERFYQA